MLTPEAIRQRVDTEPDFVNLKRYGYSLTNLLEQFPDGCPDKVMAAALDMTEVELKSVEDALTLKLRGLMKVEVED